jgi:hypothetical protein
MVEDLYLKAIVDSFSRIQLKVGLKDLKENDIRNHLVYDLENNNNILKPLLDNATLKLTKENTLLISPSETKRTDIEFFISLLGDFVVECKRLGSIDSRYINEGVHRFTNEIYAAKDTEAGMIGFVNSGDIDTICPGMNLKIQLDDSYIDDKGSLPNRCNNFDYSFHTLFKRKSKKEILIHHLFVKLA